MSAVCLALHNIVNAQVGNRHVKVEANSDVALEGQGMTGKEFFLCIGRSVVGIANDLADLGRPACECVFICFGSSFGGGSRVLRSFAVVVFAGIDHRTVVVEPVYGVDSRCAEAVLISRRDLVKLENAVDLSVIIQYLVSFGEINILVFGALIILTVAFMSYSDIP